MSYFPNRISAVVLVLAVFFGLAAQAPSQDTPTTIFLLVRAKSSLTKGDLESTLKLGLEGTNCKYDSPVIAKTIPPGVFYEMEKLVGIGVPADPLAAEAKEIMFRQVPSLGGLVLEVKLPKRSMQLKEMNINYRKTGEVVYKLKGEKTDGVFSLVQPGVYTLPMPKEDDEPINYQATVLDKGVPQPVMKGDINLGPKYFTVRIKNFVGNKKEVFEFVSNPKKIANPLHCEELKDYSFVFANLDPTSIGIKPAIDDDHIYRPNVSHLRGGNPQRVWMLFPLTKEEAEKEVHNYRKFDFLELPKEIRKNHEVISLNKIAELSPASPPKWFELTSDGQAFTRGIKLNDLPALQKKFPEWHRLTVYEFQSGDNPPQAIRVIDEKSGQDTFVIDENVRELSSAIQKLLNKPGK